jgi:hypothetical protein
LSHSQGALLDGLEVAPYRFCNDAAGLEQFDPQHQVANGD